MAPRDRGLRLRNSPQKIWVPGGRPPAPPFPLRHRPNLRAGNLPRGEPGGGGGSLRGPISSAELFRSRQVSSRGGGESGQRDATQCGPRRLPRPRPAWTHHSDSRESLAPVLGPLPPCAAVVVLAADDVGFHEAGPVLDLDDDNGAPAGVLDPVPGSARHFDGGVWLEPPRFGTDHDARRAGDDHPVLGAEAVALEADP